MIIAAAIAVRLETADEEPGDDQARGSDAAAIGLSSQLQVAITSVHDDTLPSCPACEVDIRPAGSFGHIDDEVLLRNIPIVERDSRGRFYATVRSADDHEIIVYDSAGRFVRTVGRRGDGPGEFVRVWDLLVGPGDTLFVSHGNMLTTFDSAGTVVRTVRLSPPTGSSPDLAGVIESGFIFSYSHTAARTDSSRPPLHLYDREGSLVRSFGPPGVYSGLPGAAFSRASARPLRDLTEASGFSIWATESRKSLPVARYGACSACVLPAAGICRCT